MKNKKIIELCVKSGNLIVIDTEQGQWIGTGAAYYPFIEDSELGTDEICKLYDITESKKTSMLLSRETASGNINLNDNDPTDTALDAMEIKISDVKTDMVAYMDAEQNVYLIQSIYLEPFDSEEIRAYKRTVEGKPVIVFKLGMFLVGIVAPFKCRQSIRSILSLIAERAVGDDE